MEKIEANKPTKPLEGNMLFYKIVGQGVEKTPLL